MALIYVIIYRLRNRHQETSYFTAGSCTRGHGRRQVYVTLMDCVHLLFDSLGLGEIFAYWREGEILIVLNCIYEVNYFPCRSFMILMKFEMKLSKKPIK